jgi:hypothetical protein
MVWDHAACVGRVLCFRYVGPPWPPPRSEHASLTRTSCIAQSKIVGKVSLFCWMFLVVGVGSLAAAAVQQYCFGVLGQTLARRIRRLMLRSIMYQVSTRPFLITYLLSHFSQYPAGAHHTPPVPGQCPAGTHQIMPPP